MQNNQQLKHLFHTKRESIDCTFAGSAAALPRGGARERAAERSYPAAGGTVHQGAAECRGGVHPTAEAAAVGGSR